MKKLKLKMIFNLIVRELIKCEGVLYLTDNFFEILTF